MKLLLLFPSQADSQRAGQGPKCGTVLGPGRERKAKGWEGREVAVAHPRVGKLG